MRIIVDLGDDPGDAERELVDAVRSDGEVTVYVWRRSRRVATHVELPASVDEGPV